MVINDIELKRRDLIRTAMMYGMNSNKTIKCSQELDLLLLQEMKCRNEIYPKKGNKQNNY